MLPVNMPTRSKKGNEMFSKMNSNWSTAEKRGMTKTRKYTISEFAEHIKSPVQRLSVAIGHYPLPPPVSSPSNRRKYYELEALTAWWASVPDHMKVGRKSKSKGTK